VRDPKVFLFDEPLSNLDAALRVATRIEIAKLHHDMDNVTMIYVTHDQVEAMTMADRICVLRDGIVEQVGTPMELYEKPQSLFVAGFIGSPKMNFLTGPAAAAHGAHTLGIRAEHLNVDETSPEWTGTVIHVENLGSDSFVYLDLGTGGEPVCLRQEGKRSYDFGARIGIPPISKHLHRFDANGKPIQG
jgi:multiple sugar transport system ATP-binding protein